MVPLSARVLEAGVQRLGLSTTLHDRLAVELYRAAGAGGMIRGQVLDLEAEGHDVSMVQLIDLLSRVPGEVQRAAQEYKTLHITNLVYELARKFSEFYNQCPVLNAEPAVRAARLRLVAAAKQTLGNLLGVLGIQAPEVM